MAVTCTGEGRVLRAALSGEVDHHGARAIMEELNRQIDLELPRELTIDLAGVTFMDSSGIALILCVVRRMRSCAGAARVVAPPGRPPRKVIDAAGISRVVRIDDSAEGGEN